MRFSLNFIKEFLKVEMSVEKLASLLTMAGMEVEHTESIGDDYAFDIEVTTNRYDWLSMIGIGREIAACLHKKIKVKYPKITKTPVFKDKKIIIENDEDCPFYIGRIIRGVATGASPSWLETRVSHCGINAINNVVDITNYCMLKWGNPLHVFDEDKIEGDVYIRRAKRGEVFVGIDEKERVLDKENLVIADNKKVIALAGIIGGKNTEVDNNTKNIFLEAALFSPLTIRRSRRTAGVDTDSSYRFERKVSAEYLEYASSQAASLIKELGRGQFIGYKEAGKKPVVSEKKIVLSLSGLNSYLGADFPQDKVKRILSNLEFRVEKISSDRMKVSVPSFRLDIDREVDVYEEVSRIFGYGNIKESIPFLTNQSGKDEIYEFKHDLRKIMPLFGLKEIITYSIVGEQELEKLNQKNFINIINPLRKQENVLRTTLFTGMLRSAGYNLNREQKNLKFFEIADIYYKENNKPIRTPMLSLGSSGRREDFFHLKGIIEGILKILDIKGVSFKENPIINFSSALKITASGKELGFLGKADDKIRQEYNLKEDLFFAEMDVKLLNKYRGNKEYKPFSLCPVIWRDISIELKKSVKFEAVEKIVKENSADFLAGCQIIDIYREAAAYDPLVFTLRIFYQAKDRTLTSQEAAVIHDNIREILSKKEGINLR